MSGRKTYAYRVLQYRHDPMAGELVNVGVMVHSAESCFLDIRVRSSLGRLDNLYIDLDRRTLTSGLHAVETAVAVAAGELPELLSVGLGVEDVSRRILGPGDGCFVWGAVGSGTTVDLPAALDRLYQRFVERHDVHAPRRRTDDDVWRPVRQMLEQRHIAHLLEPKVIQSSVERVEFAHSWKNGKYHCHQAMAFDYVKGDHILDKARRWAGILHSLTDSEDEFQIYFLLGAPQDQRLNKEYDIARRMLEKCPQQPEIYEDKNLDCFVDRIEDSIHRQAAH
jgi:hypothetical protein